MAIDVLKQSKANTVELVDRVKDLIQQGNVRRLIIRSSDDKLLLEIPLTAGLAVGVWVVMLSMMYSMLGGMP